MMWWVDGFHWSWMLFGGLMMFIFWGGLIALAIVITRGFSRETSSPKRAKYREEDTALQILEERYAKGELSKQVFEVIRADITD